MGGFEGEGGGGMVGMMRVGVECDMRDVWMKEGVNKGMLNIGTWGYWSW